MRLLAIIHNCCFDLSHSTSLHFFVAHCTFRTGLVIHVAIKPIDKMFSCVLLIALKLKKLKVFISTFMIENKCTKMFLTNARILAYNGTANNELYFLHSVQ